MTAQSLVRGLASLVTAAFFSLASLFNPRAHASLVSSVESVNIYNQNSFPSLATIFSSLVIRVFSCNTGTESFLLMSVLFKLSRRGPITKGAGGWGLGAGDWGLGTWGWGLGIGRLGQAGVFRNQKAQRTQLSIHSSVIGRLHTKGQLHKPQHKSLPHSS